MATPPAPTTLRAFGITSQPTPLAGGRGLCYHAGGIVLRPSDDEAESQWLCQTSAALLARNPTAYRLATPIPCVGSPDIFVVDGWTASTFISGEVSLQRFPELFHAARTLHYDLAELVLENPPAVAGRGFNRFDEADRVTWGEKTLDDVEKVNSDMLGQLQPILGRLKAVMRPLPVDDVRLRPQLIHMDLLGNVLFEEGKSPGIIDLTFYWRPALYAEAVMVADGLTRLGDLGPGLVDLYLGDASDDEETRYIHVQLLARALYWRYLTFSIDPDLDWVRVNLPKADYAGATDVVCHLATS